MTLEVSTGHFSNRNIHVAVKQSVTDAIGGLSSEPSYILLFISSYDAHKSEYFQIYKYLRNEYPNTQIMGTTVAGTFTDSDYSIRGASALALRGIQTDIRKVSRVRAGASRKGRKFAKKIAKEVASGDDNYAIFVIPPGTGFPKKIARAMAKEYDGFNLLGAANIPLIKWMPKVMKLSGRVLGRILDNIDFALPNSAVWRTTSELNKQDLHFFGCMGADPLNFTKPIQFYTGGLTTSGMVSTVFRDPNLKFGYSLSNGITVNKTIPPIKIQGYIPGGFVTKMNGDWASKVHYELTNTPKSIYNKHFRKFFYFNSFTTLCIEGNDNNYGTYIINSHPNMNIMMTALPDYVVENKKYKNKFYLGTQSAQDILNNTWNALDMAKNNGAIDRLRFGMFLECANRAFSVSSSFKKLLSIYKEYMGDNPFIGAIVGGEIASGEFPLQNCCVVSLLAGH